jgi:hypothetical protein
VWVFNIGGPWLLLAFWLGTRARRVRDAVVAGGLALGIAVLTYYAFTPLYDPPAEIEQVPRLAGIWTAIAAVAGGGFGAAGGVWRLKAGRVRAAAVAVIGAAMAGEALVQYVRRGRSGEFLDGMEFAIGVLLPLLLLADVEERRTAYLVLLALTVLAYVATLVVRLTTGALV